jgi:hypothetical protein
MSCEGSIATTVCGFYSIDQPRFVAQQLYERFRRIHTLRQLETVGSRQTRFVAGLPASSPQRVSPR